MCNNGPREPFDYAVSHSLPYAFEGSYPPHSVLQVLDWLEGSPLQEVFHYDISFFWATHELTQFSDHDLSNPSCGNEWAEARHLTWGLVNSSDGWFCQGCETLLPRLQAEANAIDPGEFPFSGARSDCFLGYFALFTIEFLCTKECGDQSESDYWDTFHLLWRRVQLELEALLFFLELPLTALALSAWPMATLLRILGASLRGTFGNDMIPNECDLHDDADASAFRSRLQSFAKMTDFDLVPEVAKSLLTDVQDRLAGMPNGCPFGHAAAYLAIVHATTIWPSVQMPSNINFEFEAIDALKVWDAVHGERVGNKRRFFYDMLTTRWPWQQLLESIRLFRGHASSTFIAPSQASAEVQAVGVAEQKQRCLQRVLSSEERWRWQASAFPFPGHGEIPLAGLLEPFDLSALASRICSLEGLEVLFISGTSSGYKWGSFTVRGRQAARGLRQARHSGPVLRSRAWNYDCEDWCKGRRGAESPVEWSEPAIVVHVKYPCFCAMELLASTGARHVYDPVDQFAYVPEGMDAILAQTSSAAHDYMDHPIAKARGTRSFWHPMHHSNFLNFRVSMRQNVTVVGMHTTHNDTELQDAVESTLAERFPGVRFLHIDPTERFSDHGGHVVSPQQTSKVYRQFDELDIAVLRHTGCMQHLNCENSRSWFCDRYKTGQRLVNAFAVGLPAVFWSQQGFLDVVAGSEYPAVAANLDDLVRWVARLVSDDALRAQVRRQALSLAEPYDLSRVSDRLVLLLAEVMGRPAIYSTGPAEEALGGQGE